MTMMALPPRTTTTTTTTLWFLFLFFCFLCSVSSFSLRPSHTSRAATTSSLSAFQSASSSESNARAALDHLLEQVQHNDDDDDADGEVDSNPRLAFLMVGAKHADQFVDVVQHAKVELGAGTRLVSIVEGGQGMSLLIGTLPEGADVDLLPVRPDASTADIRKSLKDEHGKQEANNRRPPSYLVFADPYSTKTSEVLDVLEEQHDRPIIAGGISAPTAITYPTLAIDQHVLRPKSIVAVKLKGGLGLQTVSAPGCRAIGPTYTVTKIVGNAIAELDGRPAIPELQNLAETLCDEDKDLLRDSGVLAGIKRDGRRGFRVRPVVGFRPQSGSLLVRGRTTVGDEFRFHVHDPIALEGLMERVRTERLYAGPSPILAALRISCASRIEQGDDERAVESLFGDYSVLRSFQHDGNQDGIAYSDIQSRPPIAGFLAKGEFGPIGIRVGQTDDDDDDDRADTQLHGFSTMVAMLCDCSQQHINDDVDDVFAQAHNVHALEDVWG